MLLRLAWRNIWRNRRRTVISASALALGVMAIACMHSILEVAYAPMVRGIATGLIGHAQVHGRGCQDSPEMTTLVTDAVTVEARLKTAAPGAQTERRVVGAGLAGSDDRSTAVMVLGIEPESAKVLLTIEQGRTLGGSAARDVAIGTELARELGLAPGGEMILVGSARRQTDRSPMTISGLPAPPTRGAPRRTRRRSSCTWRTPNRSLPWISVSTRSSCGFPPTKRT